MPGWHPLDLERERADRQPLPGGVSAINIHLDPTARYHVNVIYYTIDLDHPCTDNGCTRDHVHVLTDDDYRRHNLNLSGHFVDVDNPDDPAWADPNFVNIVDHHYTDGDYTAPKDR